MPFFDLTGQTAMVTGGAAGIGEAICRRLAAAGATVAIADIDLAAATVTSQEIPNSFPVHLDVTDGASVQSAVDHIVAQTGRLDILVNNAGIAGKSAPIGEQNEADWDRVIAINMTGVFLCTRAAVVHMRTRQYGRIVNIASIAGKEGNPNMVAYSATKAAVIGLTKSVAKEVATESICINAVAPAVVRTKILDQLTPQQVTYMTDKIPMRRTGQPEEIAAVVHFLASPDCSFVTGQCYDASGGRATY
ncbi:MAG: SDR family NAD(P)-dependent oxidoreductase [Bryobacteraceae bacterium]